MRANERTDRRRTAVAADVHPITDTRRPHRLPAALALAGATLALLLTVVGPVAPARAGAADDLEHGDVLVGTSQGIGFFSSLLAGQIERIRDGEAEPYCQSTLDGTDPGWFFIPDDVLVDSSGRVVFLAYLGSPFFSGQHYGLIRCDGFGSAPERLALFRSGSGDPDQGWPVFEHEVQSIGGLHLARADGVVLEDGADPRFVTEDAYVLSVVVGGVARVFRYGASTREWTEGRLPAYRPGQQAPDLTNHAGATYSVSDNVIGKSTEPLRVEASGTIDGLGEFSVALSMFGGYKEIGGGQKTGAFADIARTSFVLDDLTVPNPSVCQDDGSGISTAVPYSSIAGGTYTPPNAFRQIVVDPVRGLTVTADHFTPYLTQISETYLNDDPSDDRDDMFLRPEFGCIAQRSIKFTPILPISASDPPEGEPAKNSSHRLVSSESGMFGSQWLEGRVVRVVSGDHVLPVASGLLRPTGIAAYPPYVPPVSGAALIIRVDSPVDVLVTDAHGRQIGVADGEPVNDFGENGFDTGPGEPRLFAIKNPAGGEFSVESVGTGEGPFAIHAYSLDLTRQRGEHVVTRGTASVGATGEHDFTLAGDGSISFVSVPDDTPPTTTATASPEPNANGWNNTGVTVELEAVDGEDGSGVAEIVYALGGSETVVSGDAAEVTIAAEGETRLTYFARDEAGNEEEPRTLTVRIDRTPPEVSTGRAPAPNLHGWNNEDVTATFEAEDALSGIDGEAVVRVVFSREAADQSATRSFSDLAGNTASATVSGVSIDKTPPELAGTRTPEANEHGWNNEDVTVRFACEDALSGIDACGPTPQPVESEGRDQSRTGSAADLAGNTASATVSGISIDKAPPTVTCVASPDTLWPPNHTLVDATTSVDVADALSGPAGFLLAATASDEPDDAPGNGDGNTTGDMAGWTLGTSDTTGKLRAERDGDGPGRVYALDYTGADLAGNAATCGAEVRVPHDRRPGGR